MQINNYNLASSLSTVITGNDSTKSNALKYKSKDFPNILKYSSDTDTVQTQLILVKKESPRIKLEDKIFLKTERLIYQSNNKKQLKIIDEFNNEKIVKPILKRVNHPKRRPSNFSEITSPVSVRKKGIRFADDYLNSENITLRNRPLAEIIEVESYRNLNIYRNKNSNNYLEFNLKEKDNKKDQHCQCTCIFF